MKKSHSWRIALLVFLLTCAALLRFLRSEPVGDWICETVREKASSGGLGEMRISFGQCAFDPWESEVRVTELAIDLPGNPSLRLAASRIQLQVLRPELLARRVRLGHVKVSGLEVALTLDPSALERGAEQAAATSAACALTPLDRFRVGQLTLEDARFALHLPEGRGVELSAIELSAYSSRSSHTLKLSAGAGTLRNGPTTVLPIARLRLSAALDLDADELTIAHAELSAGDFSLFVRGALQQLCETPQANALLQVSAPLNLIDAMLLPDAALAMKGHASLSARLEGTLDAPTIEGDLSLIQAGIAGFEIGDAYLAARLEHEKVTVERLDLHVGAQQARLTAEIGLTEGLPTQARVQLDQIGFGRLLDMLTIDQAWPDFRASGPVEVKGTLLPFHLAGKARLDVQGFKVFDRGWDERGRQAMLELKPALLEMDVDFTPQRAHLSNAELTTAASHLTVDAQLFFDVARGLDIGVQIHHLDLSDLGHIVQIPWSGVVEGQAQIQGPYSEIAIDGRVEGQRLRFHDLDFGTARIDVRFADLVLAFPSIQLQRGRSRFEASGELDFRGKAPEGRGQGHFEDAWLSDLVTMIGKTHWIFDFVRDRAEARLRGTARVQGELLKPDSRVHVELDDLVYYGRAAGAGVFDFRTQDGEIVAIDRFDIDGPVGQASMTGEIRLSEGLDFHIHAPALSVFELSKPQGEFLDASGAMTLTARLFGPFDDVRMLGEAELTGVSVLGVTLGDGPLDVGMDQGVLWLRGPLGEALHIEGRMATEGALPFAVDVRLSTRQLGRYLPQDLGFDGALKASVRATGTVDALERTRGTIDVESLQLAKARLRVWSTAPFQATFDGSAVAIPAFALRGSDDFRLNGTVYLSDQGQLDGSIDAQFDARFAEAFFPSVKQTAGPIQAGLSLAGTLQAPTILGTMHLRGVRGTLRDLPVNAQDLRGTVTFSQNKLYLDGIEGGMNDGRLSLNGALTFDGIFDLKHFDLALAFDGAQFQYPSWLPSTLSGNLRLNGDLSSFAVDGGLSVSNVRYQRDIDFDLKSLLMRLGKRTPDFIRSGGQEKAWLRFDLGVHLGNDVWLDNNVIKARLGGDLQVVGNNLNLGAIGTVRVEDLGKVFFRGNEFELTRATLDFTDRDRIAAILDVHGETSLRDYRVFLRLLGSLDEPELTLSSEPELDQADLLLLLTLGFTTRETEMANSTSVGVGLIGETLLNLSGLDKQVKRFMPTNAFFRDFNIQFATQYSEVSGMVEPMAQFESKLLTDDLSLRLTQPVLSNKGRQAHLEYRVNRHLSTQMQWSDEGTELSLGDIGLDLKLRWELR
ncbi:MAG: translocation/assembly module TamB [Myxococcales bacterium]|jgi:translocation and assembly module TamB|nr:translocation/assembly module TamB [Myxococcales bacterium]